MVTMELRLPQKKITAFWNICWKHTGRQISDIASLSGLIRSLKFYLQVEAQGRDFYRFLLTISAIAFLI